MYPVTDLVDLLSGDWRLERALADLNSGARGSFEGQVSFEPLPDGTLRQRENGELTWGTHRSAAYRRLLMRPTDERGDPGVLEVLFDDGRPFHLLDLRSGSARTEHVCGHDLYRGHFHTESANAWSYRWTVTGLGKSLCLTSVLTRSA